MKKYLVIIFLIIGISCSTNKSLNVYSSISQEQFLEMPFGFKESILNFEGSSNPKFSIQKVLRRNKHYPEKTDTIYKFTYKKSEIFFYKTHMNQEFLLTGKVLNKGIVLKNEIQIGISKSEFESRFSEKLKWQNDSITMTGEATKYTFIFESDKLAKIDIDNYFN